MCFVCPIPSTYIGMCSGKPATLEPYSTVWPYHTSSIWPLPGASKVWLYGTVVSFLRQRHNRLTNHCACMLPVMVIVPPMQSIGGNNKGTYTLYMSPLMPQALGLVCPPCSEPWQQNFSDCQLVVMIWGLWEWCVCISGNYLSENCLGALKVCWQHPLKVLGICLTIHNKKLLISSFTWLKVH